MPVVEKRPRCESYETMHDSNFTARERVAHKLTGAAYQMTFVEEYDLAMQTAARAIEFWEETRDEPLSDDEASSLYGRDGPTESLPKAVTDGMGAVQLAAKPETEQTEETGDGRAGGNNQGPAHRKRTAGVNLPSRGTQAREVVAAMLRANDDGEEWVTTGDLKEYGASNNGVVQTANLAKNKSYINWKRQDGERAHLYRISHSERDAVREALRDNDQ